MTRSLHVRAYRGVLLDAGLLVSYDQIHLYYTRTRMVGRKDGNIGHDGMALLGFRVVFIGQPKHTRAR